MPHSHEWFQLCFVHPQSLGGGRFHWIQFTGIFCFFPSKMRGYLSHPRIFSVVFEPLQYFSIRSFSCSSLSNWRMTVPSLTSSLTIASSALGLFTANTIPFPTPGSVAAGRTRQCVQTRSPFFNSRDSFSTLRFLAAPPPSSRKLALRFSGVRPAFRPAPPAARDFAPRTSSLPSMNRRIICWSSYWRFSKFSRSSAAEITRVVLRDLTKLLNMQRAWYHIITTSPSAPSFCISTRRPIRRSPFSILRTPSCACRSRHWRSRHMARPPPPRGA
mmetsp:Transcript_41295/g.116890  ORF Transcript_41295/g.116890 Transcript_41295/m.116890 type:complete len:273 (+) Transcript_41295:275-1093(+)